MCINIRPGVHASATDPGSSDLTPWWHSLAPVSGSLSPCGVSMSAFGVHHWSALVAEISALQSHQMAAPVPAADHSNVIGSEDLD